MPIFKTPVSTSKSRPVARRPWRLRIWLSSVVTRTDGSRTESARRVPVSILDAVSAHLPLSSQQCNRKMHFRARASAKGVTASRPFVKSRPGPVQPSGGNPTFGFPRRAGAPSSSLFPKTLESASQLIQPTARRSRAAKPHSQCLVALQRAPCPHRAPTPALGEAQMAQCNVAAGC
jgi:hypothetical protein